MKYNLTYLRESEDVDASSIVGLPVLEAYSAVGVLWSITVCSVDCYRHQLVADPLKKMNLPAWKGRCRRVLRVQGEVCTSCRTCNSEDQNLH